MENAPTPAGPATPRAPSWARSLVLMLVAAIGFAVMNASVKAASAHLPVLEIVFGRSFSGALLVIAWAHATGAPLRVHNRRVMALRAAAGTTAMILTFYALALAPLAEASALLNVTPLFVAAISAIWLNERASRLVVACLVAGLAGVLLIFRPHQGAGAGGLVALGAALTSALAMVSLRHLGGTEGPLAVVAWFLGTASTVTLALGHRSFVVPDAPTLGLVLLSGLSSTIAQVAMTRAYAEDKAARVGGMNYLNVVASLALSTLLFGERPDPLALAGIATIIAAGAGLAISARLEPR